MIFCSSLMLNAVTFLDVLLQSVADYLLTYCLSRSRYINRNAEELQQIKNKSGALGNTKQHAARKDAIQFAMKTERQEYDSTGFGKSLTAVVILFFVEGG